MIPRIVVAPAIDRTGAVLPVDKPVDPTSHDIVAAARRALDTRRIGHTGTLDPFASGLLLLCIGPATRLAEYLTGLDKTYRATVRLGAETDTDDRTGRVLSVSDAWRSLGAEAIEAACATQRGPIDQVPPTYSAKRVQGQRMHRLARRGQAVRPRPVRVTIHRLEILALDLPDVEIEVECSSGTYIRAIARDLGREAGVGAHLLALRRTRIGPHSVAGAVPGDGLDERAAVQAALLPPLAAVSHLPLVRVGEPEARALRHGGSVAAPAETPPAPAVAVSYADRLLAIACSEDGRLRPRKVFAHE